MTTGATLRERLRTFVVPLANAFVPTESIGASKEKWNNLAERNARYYVLTDKGQQITEEEFRKAGERDVAQHFTGDSIINAAFSHLNKTTVLEVGCGIGRLTEFIAAQVREVWGVDISDEMIAKARERVPLPNVTFYATDGFSFPMPDKSVDLVFSYLVFQHMPDEGTILRNFDNIARILKPGGIAKVQLRGTPVKKTSWFYGPAFTLARARRLASSAGLNIVHSAGEGNRYFWVWMAPEIDPRVLPG